MDPSRDSSPERASEGTLAREKKNKEARKKEKKRAKKEKKQKEKERLGKIGLPPYEKDLVTKANMLRTFKIPESFVVSDLLSYPLQWLTSCPIKVKPYRLVEDEADRKYEEIRCWWQKGGDADLAGVDDVSLPSQRKAIQDKQKQMQEQKDKSKMNEKERFLDLLLQSGTIKTLFPARIGGSKNGGVIGKDGKGIEGDWLVDSWRVEDLPKLVDENIEGLSADAEGLNWVRE
jgi:hypothetical protein